MIRWWRSLRAKPMPAVKLEPNRGYPTEIEEADVQKAYIVGLAQGEIRGRLGLSRELEAQYGPGAEKLDPEELPAIVARQLH